MSIIYGVTIREILNLPEMKDVKVVAGSKGLDRIVTSLNVMEVPDVGDWIKEGELLLTTGFAIKDDNNALINLIPLLNSKNLAGIAIKPKRYIGEITQNIIDIAETLDFPILEFPFYMSYSDLISPILGAIANEQASILNRIEDAHNRIVEILVNNGDITKTIQTLRDLTKNPIEIRDNSNLLIASAVDVSELEEIKIRNNSDELESVRMVKLPIIALNTVLGNIFCFEMYSKLTRVDYITLERANELIALDLMNKEKIKEIAKHYKNQFFMELIEGSINDEKYILERGAQLEWELDQSMSVFVIDINFASKISDRDIIIESITNKIHTLMEKYESHPILVIIDTRIILLVPITKIAKYFSGDDASKLIQFGISIEEQVFLDDSDYEANVCIGRVYNSPKGFAKSYNEAKKVLRMINALYCKKKVFYYDDLGIYKLFDNINEDGISFIKDMLSPLIEYDEKKESVLMETLGGYFKCNCNIKQMAQMQYIHYNTALYRLEQIEKLLKIDLKNPDDKLNVELALKLSNYLK